MIWNFIIENCLEDGRNTLLQSLNDANSNTKWKKKAFVKLKLRRLFPKTQNALTLKEIYFGHYQNQYCQLFTKYNSKQKQTVVVSLKKLNKLFEGN